MGWYLYQESLGFGAKIGAYVTGIGTVNTTGRLPLFGIPILAGAGGRLVMSGAVFSIVSKKLRISGGNFMLLGLLLFVIDFIGGISEFSSWVTSVVVYYDSGSVLWGRFSGIEFSFFNRLSFGFFIALAGGVLGLLGGILEYRISKLNFKII